jgi:hypothetical protein
MAMAYFGLTHHMFSRFTSDGGKKSPAKVEATWEICNLNLWMAQAYYGLIVSVVVTLRVVDCEEISESPNF